MEKIVNSRVKLKKDTQANWQAKNPVLLDGEIAIVEIGSDIAMKVGDGVTAYNALEFIATTADEPADSAVKLETARKIGLSGAAVGTGTAFDGTKDINIPVTSIKEAFVDWGGKDIQGGFSPLDAGMVSELGANRFAFMNPDCISVEYSNDGGVTWTDSGATNAQKLSLFSGIPISDSVFTVGKSTNANPATANSQLRITLTHQNSRVYNVFKKFVMRVATNGSLGCKVTIQVAKNSDLETFLDVAKNIAISGNPFYNVINTQGDITFGMVSSHCGKIRFIFSITSQNNTNNAGLQVTSISGFGGVGWQTPSNMAKNGHIYAYDESQNVTFPARVKTSATPIADTELTNKKYVDEQIKKLNLGFVATEADM